jgi:hypothetical protein
MARAASRSVFPLYRGEPASLDYREFVFTELREFSGLPGDTLKRWIRNGVIQPTPKTLRVGTGKLRLFPITETIVASALAPFFSATMALELLGLLARVFRNALEDRLIGKPESDVEQLHRDVRRALIRAAYGVGQNLVAVAVTETIHVWAFTDTPFDLNEFRIRTKAPATAPVVLVDMTVRLAGIIN